jgi:hypothetical protein
MLRTGRRGQLTLGLFGYHRLPKLLPDQAPSQNLLLADPLPGVSRIVVGTALVGGQCRGLLQEIGEFRRGPNGCDGD